MKPSCDERFILFVFNDDSDFGPLLDVAVATGITSMSWQTKAGNAKVVVYALP